MAMTVFASCSLLLGLDFDSPQLSELQQSGGFQVPASPPLSLKPLEASSCEFAQQLLRKDTASSLRPCLTDF